MDWGIPGPSTPTGPTVFKELGGYVSSQDLGPPTWLDPGVATPWSNKAGTSWANGFPLLGTWLEEGEHRAVGTQAEGMQEKETREVQKKPQEAISKLKFSGNHIMRKKMIWAGWRGAG